MNIHPQYDLAIFNIGPFAPKWYGFMYVLALVTAYLLGTYRIKKKPNWDQEMISDLVIYGAMGVMLGGRIGYVLFYQFDQFIANPLYLVKAWEGGMSFHGGFWGVALAMLLVSRKYQKTPFQIFDFIAPTVPLGLMFGRMGNYINGELWGRVSDGGYSWLMAFPQARQFDASLIANNPKLMDIATNYNGYSLLPRHPSQLYEAMSEGVLLFIVLWWFSAKPRPRYAVTALFLIGYGIARFSVEFFRQPDYDQPFRLFGFMTKGQYLTLPMILIGVFLLILAYKKKIIDK